MKKTVSNLLETNRAILLNVHANLIFRYTKKNITSRMRQTEKRGSRKKRLSCFGTLNTKMSPVTIENLMDEKSSSKTTKCVSVKPCAR